MKLIVTYKGERHEFGKPGMKDLVMLERQFKVGAQALQDDPRMEYMLFLAYCALKRSGVVTGKYTDDFLDEVDELESEGGEDEDEAGDEAADPTGATPSQQPA